MKCRSCIIGEHYLLYPLPGQTDDDEPIELVECPIGEGSFHLADKRCNKSYIRRDLERGVDNEEQVSETD